MKIIITTPLYNPEIAKPAPYVKDLAVFLAQKYLVTILTYTNIHPKSQDYKIEYILKNQATFLRLLKYFFKLFKISKKTDIIYTQTGISSSLISVLVGLIRKKPIIFRFNEDEAFERSKRLGLSKEKNLENFLKNIPRHPKIFFIKYLQKFVLQNSTLIISSSEYFKKIISKYYKIHPKKIKVIHSPVPKKIIVPFSTKKIPEQIFVPGEYLSAEDLMDLLNFMPMLHKKYPNIKLIISGETKIDKEKFKKQKYIDFLGFPSKAEKFFLIKTSLLYIINTSHKYDPSILFFPLLAKTTIICSQASGLDEVIRHNQTGLQTKNKEDLFDKIDHALSDKNLRERLENKALFILQKKFSWQNHINKLETIFHEQK